MVQVKKFLKNLLQFSSIYLDTNCFIYHLEAKAPYCLLTEALFQSIETGKIQAHTSVLTLLELNTKLYQKDLVHFARTQTSLLKYMQNLLLHDFSLDMAHTAAKIRAKKNFKTPDSIHLASAIEKNCEAVLGNDRGWKKLESLPYLYLSDYC